MTSPSSTAAAEPAVEQRAHPRGPAASPFMSFTRAQWATLRANTPLPLAEAELLALRGLNEPMSVEEVGEVLLPLTRLINLYVGAARELLQVTDTFLGRPSVAPPFVIGIAGSVAAGKSTVARVLRAVLAQWPAHPRVALVTTDGFLYPNAELEARGLMQRKGFPESYDVGRLLRFLAEVKSGAPTVEAPVYSHLVYDVVEGERTVIRRPDILIVEGINVLQAPPAGPAPVSVPAAGHDAHGAYTPAAHEPVRPRQVVSDFFDFSIYVDAAEPDLRRWYVDRFLALRDTAFRDPQSYFHRFAALREDEAVALAVRIWEEINLVNLVENIEGTRERASVVLRKGPTHAVAEVQLKRTALVPAGGGA